MKAKVIKTGEIVDVYHETQHGQITNIYKESVLVNSRMWTEDELDFCVKANEAPEKIFICDYDSELGFEWHSESDWEHQSPNDIGYTRTDAFIKKACDAYCKVCGHYPHTVPTHICRQACDYYKDFRACIKGE